MRKLLLIPIAAVIFFVAWNFSNLKFHKSSDKKSIAEKENFSDKEDGIRLAQEQEFEQTKDVTLGYVPKYRLIKAIDDLMKQQNNRGSSTNQTSLLSWTERGPNSDAIGPSNGNTRGTQAASDAVTSGRMRAIWVDLSDATNHTVWAGGVDGGLWKSTNITSTSAAVWSPANDFFGNLAIGTICQSPAGTKDTMYFGTGEKTFNADAVKGGGIWRSVDHGLNWSLLAATSGFSNVSKIVCDASGFVYAATMGGGLLRSTDKGVSWTDISPTGLTNRVTELRISSTGRLHVVCGYLNSGTSGYRYTDAPSTVTSGTWTSPATTFPTFENSELAVGGSGSTLYALPANASDLTPTIYKSTDGGANWAACTTSPPSTASEPSINTGQGWYDLAIGVDPTNDNNVIAGGLNFYRSTDGGNTWSQITRWVGTSFPYVHADHHTVVWSSGSQVLVGSDGGIFYSADGGTTWADRNDGLRLKQFYSCAIHPSSTNYFLGGAQDNGVHQLNGAGLTSSVEVTGGDGMFVHIDQDEPQYQFGSYVYNNYRRSTDGGSTWSSINFGNFGQFVNPTDYDDIGNKMYTCGSAGQYDRWDDPQTGSTLSAVSVAAFNSSTVSCITVSPYTANRVFFGTTGGRVVKIDNANTASPTATNITGASMSTTNVSCVAVGTNDNNLIATFSNYGSVKVWVSTNGGGAWTNITGDLPDIPVRWAMFFPEDNTKAIIATEMGVYETSSINGALTSWTRDPSFPVVRTDMLQYRPVDGTVLAATHGRGMWTSTIPFTTPYVRFAFNYNSRTEVTASTTGCRNYKDYTINMQIDAAPTGNANITLSSSGSATQGVDYDFTTNGSFVAPSNTLTFASGSTTPQPITIRIYNDAEVESTESFTLTYTVGGGTNAVAAPSSTSYTFTITDNDVAPVAGGGSTTNTIGAGGISGVIQPFRGNFEDARSQFIYLASELTAAGFSAGNITALGFNITSKTSTSAFTGLTISLKNTTNSSFASVTFETGTTQCYSSNYTTVSGLNTFTLTTPFNWDGTSNLLVEVCFDNANGSPPGGTGDVVSAHSTSDDKGVWNRANTSSGCSLTAGFNQFSSSFVRPDLTVTGIAGGVQIETALNSNKTEHVGNNGTYYFYTAGGNILNNLSGTSASLACVSSNIFEAGTTWQTFSGGQRSQKVFDIAPTTNSGSTYTVGLYYTSAELAGKPPATLKIAKTTAATMASANSSNTVIAGSTSFAAFGSGYVFTASFTGFSKFFLVDANVVLPVTLLNFDGHLNNNTVLLNWSTSSELNSKLFDIEKSPDGANFHSIGIVNAAGNSTVVRNYNFTDRQVNEFNYYRLKQVDVDGRFVYSRTIFIKNPNAVQNVWVLNNPFHTNLTVRFAKMPQQKIEFELMSVGGVKVYSKVFPSSGEITLDLSGMNLSSGMYLLRTKVDGMSFINKVVKK